MSVSSRAAVKELANWNIQSLPRRARIALPTRIYRILERHGGRWVNRTVIYDALGGHIPAERITAELAKFIEAGDVEYHRIVQPNGGRPSDLYRINAKTHEAPSPNGTGH